MDLKKLYEISSYDEQLNKEIIAFNKRFADGEQYISYNVLNKNREDWEGTDPETREPILEIKEKEKDYYWQENAVYNLIPLYISRFTRESKIMQTFNNDIKLVDTIVYGKLGLVDMLAPFQRAYNAAKNRKMEFLNRYMMGILCVEDGSVDVDNLETDGVTPGEDIRDDMDRICNEFIDRYNILPPSNVRMDKEGNLDLAQWISTTDGEMSNAGNIKAAANELDK